MNNHGDDHVLEYPIKSKTEVRHPSSQRFHDLADGLLNSAMLSEEPDSPFYPATHWKFFMYAARIEYRTLEELSQMEPEYNSTWAHECQISMFNAAKYVLYALEEFYGTLGRTNEEIISSIKDLHDKKQNDYGRNTDPFANVRASTSWGISGWIGALVRGTDKFRRIEKHAVDNNLLNESVEDSFLDLLVYTLIGLVLFIEEYEEFI